MNENYVQCVSQEKCSEDIITARQLMNNPCRTMCLRRDWNTFAPFLIRAANLTNSDFNRFFESTQTVRRNVHKDTFNCSEAQWVTIFALFHVLWLPLTSRTQELGRKIECSTDLNSFGRIAAIFEMTIFVADERCVALIRLSNLCCPAINIFWAV